MDYCNLKLQLGSEIKPAVCFSRSKRSLLVGKAETKTPAKLENFNVLQDGKTIFINDMMKVGCPNTSDYDFQHREIESRYASLDSVARNAADMDLVDITAKVLCKDEPTVVEEGRL